MARKWYIVVSVLISSLLFGVSAQAESQSASVQQQSPVGAPGYRINAGDEISIYVWGEERLQQQVRVLPDGTIAFPLVGQILAKGRLTSEIEQMVTAGLKDQYRGEVPQVTVSILSPAGMQISIMGRVKSPGTFTPGRYINVLEALSLAGGPNEFANLNNVLIIRKMGDRLNSFRVQLAALFRVGADDRDLARSNIQRLESGDTIIVP